MKATITPSLCKGNVHIPPSKSMSHRAIICASLAKGKSILSNIAYSQDILTTIEGMKQLGANITMEKDRVIIEGIHDFQHVTSKVISCCESGSTLRFFIPIFSLCNQEIYFQGEGRLLQRPQTIYKEIFHKQNIPFIQDEKGITISQSLKAGEYTLKGDVSSQFISGLLFTLPLLENDSIIHILPPFESRSYVDLTLQMLKIFGVHADFQDDVTLYIKGNQSYQPHNYTIEGDYSQLAFFAVLGALQNDITITGVQHNSKQGDKEIIDILRNFQIPVEQVEQGYLIHKATPIARDIDLSNCPDLGPILTVLAMYSLGNTRIYNAERLRIKESDRIAAMECELKKFGVDIHSTNGEIFIQGATTYTCHDELYGHNDHRIVMALTIAILCSTKQCTIEDAQAIHKSYPTFFDDIKAIGGKVELHDK